MAMLVLTRSIDEGLVINENIRVTVLRVSGGVVRIGIEAPQDATILRGEHLVAAPQTQVIEVKVREPKSEPQP